MDYTQVKLGKRPYVADKRTLKFDDYTPPILSFPPSVDWSGLVPSWPMFANDRLGDCTCAAAGHMDMLFGAIVNNPVTPTDDQVIALYNTVNGGSDNGAAVIDVLNSWMKSLLAGVGPLGYAFIQPGQMDHVKYAISIFAGVDTGIQLPLTAQGEDVWSATTDQPGTWGGHSVNIVAYDDSGLTCVTWGMLKKMTWEFWNKYCDEAYAVLPNDWPTGIKGFNLAQLQADLASLETSPPLSKGEGASPPPSTGY